MISLCVATAYLIRSGKKTVYSLLTALPACFMSAVSSTYILMADEGFRLGATFSYAAGALFAGALFVVYLIACRKKKFR